MRFLVLPHNVTRNHKLLPWRKIRLGLCAEGDSRDSSIDRRKAVAFEGVLGLKAKRSWGVGEKELKEDYKCSVRKREAIGE